jgi:hypothetical protein
MSAMLLYVLLISWYALVCVGMRAQTNMLWNALECVCLRMRVHS